MDYHTQSFVPSSGQTRLDRLVAKDLKKSIAQRQPEKKNVN